MYHAQNEILDKRYTRQEYPLGESIEISGKVFRFYEYSGGDGDDNAVAGGCGVHLEAGYSRGLVTCDLDSATIDVLINEAAGFAQAAFEPGEFGWWQTKGPNLLAMIVAGSVTVDGRLMPNTAVVGGVIALSGAVTHVATSKVAGTAIGVDEAIINID